MIGPKWPKTRMIKGFEKFVIILFWIWSKMKVHIINLVPAQISYLEKFWFLSYELKCFKQNRFRDS